MKSLKESIIGSNNVSIWDSVKDLVRNGRTEKDVQKLQKLWDNLNLSVNRCEWMKNDYLKCLEYVYCGRCPFITGAPELSDNGDGDMAITKPAFWIFSDVRQVNDFLIKKLESSKHVKIYKNTKTQKSFSGKFV